MSFTGDLEHLPIVDVVQLLHSTRKTGTLTLTSNAGESQLVFADGFIVSANHVNNSIRIGQILVDKEFISAEQLEQALSTQQKAGQNRKPLIATLLEGGVIKKEEAYKGLEYLIEMSIVEILTWTSGHFRLDVNTTAVSDEYRYFPETLKQEINLNTQNVLMDALRIYDEKMRNGSLESGVFAAFEQPQETPSSTGANDQQSITLDILGLNDLENLERKIPDVYSGLRDKGVSDFKKQSSVNKQPDPLQAEEDLIFSYLKETCDDVRNPDAVFRTPVIRGQIILLSKDPFIQRIITTTAKYERVQISICSDENELLDAIENARAESVGPLVTVDLSEATVDENAHDRALHIVSQIRDRFCHSATILQLFVTADNDFIQRAVTAGVDCVMPRPETGSQQIVFTEETITFLKAFQKYLHNRMLDREKLIDAHFENCMKELTSFREAPKLAYIPLKFAALMFERAITFFVGKNELISKNDIGVSQNGKPVSIRIPLEQQSFFKEAIDKGSCLSGKLNDEVLTRFLHSEIGAPIDADCVLIPVTSLDKVAAIIYADFGSLPARPVRLELLETITKVTGIALDNCLYRKQLVKQSK